MNLELNAASKSPAILSPVQQCFSRNFALVSSLVQPWWPNTARPINHETQFFVRRSSLVWWFGKSCEFDCSGFCESFEVEFQPLHCAEHPSFTWKDFQGTRVWGLLLIGYPLVARQTSSITLQCYLLDQLRLPLTLTVFVLQNCLLQTPYDIVLSGSGQAAQSPIIYEYMNIKIQSWKRHVSKLWDKLSYAYLFLDIFTLC